MTQIVAWVISKGVYSCRKALLLSSESVDVTWLSCANLFCFVGTVARQMSSNVEVNFSGNSLKEHDARRDDQSLFLRLSFISSNLA